ncbi:NAD+ transporter PWA37_000421 [Arxiozyma heterogenica]|uniref:Uncharacterized protein n=1 Tax=Arxiozyma heterogenica TaxID=278026 RepID=A0AAN7WHF4_9SACH|nr:hypothetical protein RI543_003990 [Kazachstania heterogenica]
MPHDDSINQIKYSNQPSRQHIPVNNRIEQENQHNNISSQPEVFLPNGIASLSSDDIIESTKENFTNKSTNINNQHDNNSSDKESTNNTDYDIVSEIEIETEHTLLVNTKSSSSKNKLLSNDSNFNESIDLNRQITVYGNKGESYTKPENVRRLDDTTITAISGALAGFLSGIMVCPLDVTKTRLQVQGLDGAENPYYKGVVGTMNTIVKDEGIKGLYKGLIPILLGYFPTWTIYFSVYEFSKDFYPRLFPGSDFVSHSCSAITAGAVSTTLTNPIWVIKTRLMLQSNLGPYSTQYYGTIDAFRCIWNQEGIRAFYRGLVPSLLGLFHVAIHFPVYEKLKLKFKCYSLKDNNVNRGHSEIHLPNLIAASSVSKMIASGLTYPHEILRTRMQLKSSNNFGKKRGNYAIEVEKKLIPLIKTTYRNEGIRGFYSGFTANLLRTVPASAITLVSFEYVRNKLSAFYF